MTDREKLIELIARTPCPGIEKITIPSMFADLLMQKIADHLIANGVRLKSKQATSDENKRWIPVTERLPESEKDPVLIALKWGSVDIGWCENERLGSEFVTEYDNGDVTHWMPLPEPPKEKNND